MQVGVTGAAGYIGSCISQQLLDKDMDVVLMDNFSYSKLPVRRIGDVEIQNVDVANFDVLESCFTGVDCIIHLAAISGLDECNKNDEQTANTNYLGTENIARICAEQHINLIFASSCGVIGNPTTMPITGDCPRRPLNTYTKSKYYGEQNIKSHTSKKFTAYIFMIANVYGAHYVNNTQITKNTLINKFVMQALNKENLTIYMPGTQGRDFIHVMDVSRAFVKALDHIGADDKEAFSIPIGSGKSTSVRNVADMVQSVCLNQTGYKPWIEYVENPRENEILVPEFRVDIAEAEEKLQFVAEITMKDAIRALLAEQPLLHLL